VHSLFKAVDDRMRKHLKECVGDAFRVAVAPPSLAPPSFSPLEGSRSDRSLPPKAAPVARFMEGQRVRATDGLCGRVCFDPGREASTGCSLPTAPCIKGSATAVLS